MEVKKKFEKPQMEVLKLKPAGIMSGSYVCTTEECPAFCATDCGSECLFT